MSICASVGSFIESKTSVVQISNVDFTSEVSDYLVVHTGPDGVDQLSDLPCIKYFGLPISVSCPVYRNVNDEECLPLVSVSKVCASPL